MEEPRRKHFKAALCESFFFQRMEARISHFIIAARNCAKPLESLVNFPRLPTELWFEILEKLDNSNLKQVFLTCTRLACVTRPLLFRTLHIDISEEILGETSAQTWLASKFSQRINFYRTQGIAVYV